jgi:SagB-type dehydrogenase family enzyme
MIAMSARFSRSSQSNAESALNQVTPEGLLSPSELYHENSKLHCSDLGLYAWIHYVNTSPEIRQVISRPATHYRGYPAIPLTKDFPPTPHCFEEVVIRRRSRREFSGLPMPLQTLAKILYLGDGVVDYLQAGDGSTWSLRTAPSGGGLYPIDLYCAVMRVDGLAPGLYFYNPAQHSLEQLLKQDLTQALAAIAPAAEASISQASICIILSSVMSRIKFKYGERAYRFVLLEAGHVAQNLLLAAQAEAVNAFAVGGFLDDPLNDLLHLDGVEEAALYFVLMGY